MTEGKKSPRNVIDNELSIDLMASPQFKPGHRRRLRSIELDDSDIMGSPKRHSQVIDHMEGNTNTTSPMESPIKKRRKINQMSPSPTGSMNLFEKLKGMETSPQRPKRTIEKTTTSNPTSAEKSAWDDLFKGTGSNPRVYQREEKGKHEQKQEQIEEESDIFHRISSLPSNRFEITPLNPPKQKHTPHKVYGEERSYLIDNRINPEPSHEETEPARQNKLDSLKQLGQNHIIKEDIEYMIADINNLSPTQMRLLIQKINTNYMKVNKLAIHVSRFLQDCQKHKDGPVLLFVLLKHQLISLTPTQAQKLEVNVLPILETHTELERDEMKHLIRSRTV